VESGGACAEVVVLARSASMDTASRSSSSIPPPKSKSSSSSAMLLTVRLGGEIGGGRQGEPVCMYCREVILHEKLVPSSVVR
jgi:hypothetical protein